MKKKTPVKKNISGYYPNCHFPCRFGKFTTLCRHLAENRTFWKARQFNNTLRYRTYKSKSHFLDGDTCWTIQNVHAALWNPPPAQVWTCGMIYAFCNPPGEVTAYGNTKSNIKHSGKLIQILWCHTIAHFKRHSLWMNSHSLMGLSLDEFHRTVLPPTGHSQ